MPGVLLREALPVKDMAQMALTTGTDNFYSTTIGIRVAINCPGNLIIKTGPATMGIEFVIRPVEGSIATPTVVCTCLLLMYIFP